METRSFRNRSAVGRFPSVTLSLGEEAEDDREELEERDEQTENACRRWLQKICPCCCRRSKDDDDITETLETTDEVEDGDKDKDEDEDEDKDKEEENPDGSEIDGKPPGCQGETRVMSEVAAHTVFVFLQSSSSECDPST